MQGSTSLNNRQLNTPELFAEFTADTVVVYQAFKDKIADYAVEDQAFLRGFGVDRMSWIKPSFCWLLHRSNYGRKRRQNRLLRITIRREFFERCLRLGHPSWRIGSAPESENVTGCQWRRSLDRAPAVIQWDPDYDWRGRPLERRAIQIGLRSDLLKDYARAAILEILDMTHVAQLALNAKSTFPESKSAGLAEIPQLKSYPLKTEIRKKLRVET